MMYQWGLYQFELNTAAPQSFDHSKDYQWASNKRIGERPSKQYLGRGAEDITMNITIHPHFRGGLGQIDRLNELAGTGEPQTLVRGDGKNLGQFCLEKSKESHEHLTAEGLPLKITATLSFSHYGRNDYARV